MRAYKKWSTYYVLQKDQNIFDHKGLVVSTGVTLTPELILVDITSPKESD